MSLKNQTCFSSVFKIKLIKPGVCPNTNLTYKLGIISSSFSKNLIFPSKGSLNLTGSILIGPSVLFSQNSHSLLDE